MSQASSSFGFGQNVNAQVERHRKFDDNIKFTGQFKVEVIRKGQVIQTEYFTNGVVNEGKDSILTSYFFNTAPPTTWFLAFIDNAGFSALDDANDTAASHTGWTEATGYSEPNRPTWVTTAAASQSITNPTPATFSITSTQTLKGVFTISDNVKSGTTGVLWATALFSGDIPVTNGDIIKISYAVNAT